MINPPTTNSTEAERHEFVGDNPTCDYYAPDGLGMITKQSRPCGLPRSADIHVSDRTRLIREQQRSGSQDVTAVMVSGAPIHRPSTEKRGCRYCDEVETHDLVCRAVSGRNRSLGIRVPVLDSERVASGTQTDDMPDRQGAIDLLRSLRNVSAEDAEDAEEQRRTYAFLEKALSRICKWTFDSVEWESNKWDSDCGESFTFEVGGPEENKMRFCCYCGKRLKEVVIQHDDE